MMKRIIKKRHKIAIIDDLPVFIEDSTNLTISVSSGHVHEVTDQLTQEEFDKLKRKAKTVKDIDAKLLKDGNKKK